MPKTVQVIVGCQMGGRSQFAGEAMTAAGYTDVSNMQGGFGGAKNPMGEVTVPGWMQMEYAVETEAPAASTYDELQK